MREGGSIRGLTTAASIWSVAAIGVVVGAGEYLIAVALTGLIALILEWDYLPVLSRLAARGQLERMLFEPPPPAPLRIEEHG
jgi:putative Mg2+ transporter-C (MgtC) family protein